jgi:hypothetical protein
MLITKKLIQKAIKLTRPSAIAILETEGATWGPKAVIGYIEAYGIKKRIYYDFNFDKDVEWQAGWGKPEKFSDIAEKKLDVVMKHYMNTSTIVALYPALLDEGEFLYAGGAYREGIGGASASGAKGWADEAISEILLININMLVQLEKDRRIKEDKMEI